MRRRLAQLILGSLTLCSLLMACAAPPSGQRADLWRHNADQAGDQAIRDGHHGRAGRRCTAPCSKEV